jgi:hypothetical protein
MYKDPYLLMRILTVLKYGMDEVGLVWLKIEGKRGRSLVRALSSSSMLFVYRKNKIAWEKHILLDREVSALGCEVVSTD